MVYTADLDYANHRGYTTWVSFTDANTIPTATAIIEIRASANALVNVAFHNLETDAAVFLVTLAKYELIVMDRLIADAYLIDNGEAPKQEYLTELEFNILRNLGAVSSGSIKSVSMYDKTNPFTRRGGILY